MAKLTEKRKSEIYHEIGHSAEMVGNMCEQYVVADLKYLKNKKLKRKAEAAMAALYQIYNEAMILAVDLDDIQKQQTKGK